MSIFIGILVFFVSVAIMSLTFVEKVVIRDHQKEKLRKQFETWWTVVEHKNKTEVALAVASFADSTLTSLFGKKLFFSRKLWLRGFIVSTCLLTVTLSMIGLFSKDPFWVTPWKNYQQSINIITANIDALFSDQSLDHVRQIDLTPTVPFYKSPNAVIIQIETNLFAGVMVTNVVKVESKIEPLGHGHFEIGYYRISGSGTNLNNQTNVTDLKGEVEKGWHQLASGANDIKHFAQRHSSNTDTAIYTLIYFAVLFSINGFLFVISLWASRLILKEIIGAHRLLATASLILTNLTGMFLLSSVILFLFTVFALPILWLFIPFIYHWSDESVYTSLAFCAVSTMGMWLASGLWGKLIALIAFVPSIFTVIVSLFSWLAIKWKKAFHLIVTGILIRCAEKGPFVVIGGSLILVSGLLTLIAHWLHVTAFL
jgi:hypothetical protein